MLASQALPQDVLDELDDQLSTQLREDYLKAEEGSEAENETVPPTN